MLDVIEYSRTNIYYIMDNLQPRSTLFPYTTSSDLHETDAPPRARSPSIVFGDQAFDGIEHHGELLVVLRSEEHTSELQSRFDIVCRLLLDKKNDKNIYFENIFL